MRRSSNASLAWLVIALAAVFPLSAGAWDILVDEPDVFGTSKVLATEGGDREKLVIQCDSKDQLLFAYIFRKKEFEDTPEASVKLLVRGASEVPVSADATLRSWNDSYAGVVVSGRESSALAILKEIGAATGRISIGFEMFGQQASASFGSRGSTSAVKRASEICKLETPALPPA